jgi:MinD-like ATPase involved in chromosome partitioning or flagellar assembly
MTVVALGSVRSCGSTTLSLALAATWPSGRRVLLAEFDPAGGTLGAASGWAPEPGMVSLAAAARRVTDPELVWNHCRELAGGAGVLAGPVTADQARSALGILAGLIGRLGELSADVLIDCGRLAGAFPGSILACADRLVLVARPALADLHALATWHEMHPSEPDRLGMVLVGDGPYSNAEVTEAMGVPVLARLPWDPVAAASLISLPATARELHRAPLVRAARTLAEQLSDHLPNTSRIEVDPENPLPRRGAFRGLGALGRGRLVGSSPLANGTAPIEQRS